MHPFRSAALAVALAVILGACTDDPVSPEPRRATARGAFNASAVPGAMVSVPVEVPPSMRYGVFSAERYLIVPPDFRISVFARVPGARFMAVAPNGDLLVSDPGGGKILLVRPSASGGDPAVSEWATGLYKPHDIVFHAIGGTMYVYVAEADKVARYRYTNGDAVAQAREVLISGLPSASTPELRGAYGHELKNIALDGEHRLYVSIASTCNACASDAESDPVRGAIYVYDANGGGGRLFARGLRNAEGLAFVPGTSTLWATVNNRDQIAYPFHDDFNADGTGDDYGRIIPGYVDDHPPEEFTRVRDGGNYGWPFCNPNPDTPAGFDEMPFDNDVEHNPDGSRLNCAAADRISKGFAAHSAPLGVTFFQGTRVPPTYQAGAAVALHGSWNRQRKSGYKVVLFPWNAGGAPGAPVDLVTGWASDFDQWGRPVDVAVTANGDILISDDYSGTIYRLRHSSPSATAPLVSGASGKCLDVLGASRAPGTGAVIYPCHGGDNQAFAAPASPGATGELRVYGDACLQPERGGGSNGDPIVIAGCTGAATQRWTRTAAGELRAADGRCLDVLGGHTADLTSVWLWDCHGGSNQRWADTPAAERTTALTSRASGKCLDVLGGSRELGAQLVIYPCHGGDNQRLTTLPPVGATGELRIYGDRCLDAYGGTGRNDDAMVIWSCHGGANQQWTRTTSGELRGINGRCIDVSGGRTDDLTRLVLWDCHGGDNQRWDLRD